MSVQFIERISPEMNLVIKLVDQQGTVVEDKRFHNVFTNMGRNWLAESSRVVGPVPGPDGTRKVDTTPYYIAVGQGSDQQSISPPGVGLQTEIATVTRIEFPVLYQAGLYLKEIDRPTLEPDAYTNQYQTTFLETDISFGTATAVPITEFGLVTKNAAPGTPGGIQLGAGVSPYEYATPFNNGYLIAYRSVPPITKTGLYKLQITWELRY